MSKGVIGVLVPFKISRQAPSDRPISSALSTDLGITVVFGSELSVISNTVHMDGVTVSDGRWKSECLAVSAIHDRYPSQIRSTQYRKVLSCLGDTPMGNPLSITLLCRDKIRCQRWLETVVPMPPVLEDHSLFNRAMKEWHKAYLKPQFGALGTNVHFVQAGEQLAEFLPGVVPHKAEPTILQKAITPPRDWAGLCVRQLISRAPDGGWKCYPAVLRRSRTDSVVNVARGAEAVLAEDHLSAECMERIIALSVHAARRLEEHEDGEWAVEFGIDFVIDEHYNPWLIEVNSRPRGRLEVLSQVDPMRFAALHHQAVISPIIYLYEKTKRGF